MMSAWIHQSRPNPKAKLRLFCFPFAGGGALAFRTWPTALPADIEVCAVQLPGHENRLRETPLNTVGLVVDALMPEFLSFTDKPFAFFGHSMGGLISFELARSLRANNSRLPEQMFVSARLAPQLPLTQPQTFNLPDAEFIEELRRLQGTPPEVLEHPELLELALPILRADFSICQTYTYVPDEPFDFPITAFGGLSDMDVPRTDLEAWSEQTRGIFKLRMLRGDHFFLLTSRPLLLQVLSTELIALLGALRSAATVSH